MPAHDDRDHRSGPPAPGHGDPGSAGGSGAHRAGHAPHDHGPVPSVDEHADRIRALVTLDGRESVALGDALDRVLVDAVHAPIDLPLFRNAERDGVAVRSSDLPGTLRVVGEVAARPHDFLDRLEPGTAVRIMTGAPVPPGADAVVQIEDVEIDGAEVRIPDAPPPGRWIRDRGSDLRAGSPLLTAGTRLASRHLAALAAAGIRSVEVRRRPRIALVSTGAELADEPARLGEIHDANLPALVAAVRAAGGDPVLAARVTDDPDAFADVLARAVAASDVVVTSGGISMGDHEVVREVLAPRGGWFGHIAMQPGGPQGLTVVEGVPVVSVPGNPVSTQLSVEVFLAPLLRAWTGVPQPARERRTLVGTTRSPGGKRQFLRATLLSDDRVALVGGPQSHLVASLAAADALVVVPEGVTELAAGDVVETWAL